MNGENIKLDGVPLREYIEAVMRENQRAIEAAEKEREKAAAALREQLSERIQAGDTNLREHIIAQIAQLHTIINNTEAMAVTRHDGLQREIKIQHQADQAAISKAESANEKRFEAANEWRGQSTDRERTQQEAIASFVATLTPLVKTEAIEARLADAIDRNRSDVEKLDKRMDVQASQALGSRLTMGALVTIVTVAIAIIGVIVLVANYLTSP